MSNIQTKLLIFMNMYVYTMCIYASNNNENLNKSNEVDVGRIRSVEGKSGRHDVYNLKNTII